MRIQLTRRGTAIDVSNADIQRLRLEYDQRQSIVLPQLIEPGLLAQLQDKIESASFEAKNNRDVGDELRIRSDPAATVLQFLTNDRAFLDIVERVTGCPPIGCYHGRIYRLLPAPGHESDWHPDLVEGRMLTLSINMSRQVFQGGVLQIRRVETKEICSEVANTGPGDGVLFRIHASLEHRVTPLVGHLSRTAFAGWFLRTPDFSAQLRKHLRSSSTAFSSAS